MKLFGFRFGDDATAAAWAAEADIRRDRGDWAGAARAYRASLDLDSSRADLWVQLGHALKESGDLEGSGDAYQQSLDRAPDVADTHLMLGHFLKVSGRREEAAAAYARSAELDPSRPDALNELRTLIHQGVTLDHDLALSLIGELREARRRRTADLTLADDGRITAVFDVADLIGYFHNARLPTGIQRVQIEIIGALLRDPPTDIQIGVCAFAQHRDGWVGLPAELFLRLIDLALQGGDRGEPAWRAVLDEVGLMADLAPGLRFPRGAWLINLGTSWWLQNYFLKVREARRLYGIRYLPFVHDMIPVMAPEHCTRPLTQDFISWVLGVFAHADRFLTNSEASKRDLERIAARLGHTVTDDQVQVVPLDADFRKPGADHPVAETLSRYGLSEGGFILFVSTIESRKNHLAAFRALSDLIARHGAAALPKLVCVGNHGWLNDAVFQRLEADPGLRRQVVMLSGVADADLANLYRTSAFTLYPSQYEGWGLPVTESLCYGRAVLASDSSSLPEAGGDFAAYFRLGDQAGLTEALERLILDLPWRRSLEAHIAARFRPRPWRALASDIIDRITAWSETTPAGPAATPMAEGGRYYWLRRSRETGVGAGVMAPEIFRVGEGWLPPEDWGCWTRGEAVLEARVDAAGPLRLFLGLQAPADRPVAWRVEAGGEVVAEGELESGRTRWLVQPLPADTPTDGLVRIRIVSRRPDGPAEGEATLGVIGFMLCADSDLAARTTFIEALAVDGLPALAGSGGSHVA